MRELKILYVKHNNNMILLPIKPKFVEKILSWEK